jgi:hypothetical protein
VIRLAKAGVSQDATPVVSSFNLEALALDHVEEDYTIAENLRDLLLDGADSLADGLTPDPAGVSDPITPDGVSRATAVARLRELGEAVSRAVDAETLEDAEATLSEAFPDYVESGSAVRSLGDALRRVTHSQPSPVKASFPRISAARPIINGRGRYTSGDMRSRYSREHMRMSGTICLRLSEGSSY